MAETEIQRPKKEEAAYKQAMDLVAALHRVNNYKIEKTTIEWLASESEMPKVAAEGASKQGPTKIYEGIFKAIQKSVEVEPIPLWDRAQKRLIKELEKKRTGKAGKKKPDRKPAKIPFIHQRLLRLYWMVRLAAEDLIKHNPRIRVGKVLLEVEKNLREAFVESDEVVKLPLAAIRQKQWELLGKYGMGLTVDKIYDLHPRRRVIELHRTGSLIVGIVIGLIVGIIFAYVLFT